MTIDPVSRAGLTHIVGGSNGSPAAKPAASQPPADTVHLSKAALAHLKGAGTDADGDGDGR